MAMGAANKDSQKDVARSVWVEEQSSHAAKRKFETRSDLTERAGIDTVLVPAGKIRAHWGKDAGGRCGEPATRTVGCFFISERKVPMSKLGQFLVEFLKAEDGPT